MKKIKNYILKALENKTVVDKKDFLACVDNLNIKKRKVAVIHHFDLDGSGIVLFSKIIKYLYETLDSYDYEFEITYKICGKEADEAIDRLKNEKVDLSNFTDIIICDLSVKNESYIKELDTLNENGVNVLLLDHHLTNLAINDYEWALCKPQDLKKDEINCGTSLAYTLLGGLMNIPSCKGYISCYEEFTKNVSDWDTGNWRNNKNKKADELNNIFKYYGIIKFTNKICKNIMFNGICLEKEDIVVNSVINNLLEKASAKQMHNMKIIELKKYNIGFLITEDNITNIAYYIFDNYKGKLDIIIAFNPYINAISVRTKSGKNISAIKVAEILSNGNSFGGHLYAAGTSDTYPLKWINEYFEGVILSLENKNLKIEEEN